MVATTTQKINKNQAKHWISRRSLIVPCNYKGSYSLVFGQSVFHHNTDKFSCFDNCIGFQCILFRQAFQTELSTFLLFWKGFKKFFFLLFGLFTLGIFGGPEKDREFCFCWEFCSTPWRWMAGAWLVLQGKLHGIR